AHRAAAPRGRQIAAGAFEDVGAEGPVLAVPRDPLHLYWVGHGFPVRPLRPAIASRANLYRAFGPASGPDERCASHPHALGAPVPARWRSGYAEDCKSLHAGSIPARASTFPNLLPARQKNTPEPAGPGVSDGPFQKAIAARGLGGHM